MRADALRFLPSSNYDEALRLAAAEQRIDSGYWDIFHKYREVPLETQKRILAAQGWPVEDQSVIEQERERNFRATYAAVVPPASVLAIAEPVLTITLYASDDLRDIAFQLALDDGRSFSGPLSSLLFHREIYLGDQRWAAYHWRLPEEVPLGYHRLQLTRHGEVLGGGHVILCPEHAFLPENLSLGGRTAGFNVTLYGLRSSRNWGCGDFTDLRSLIHWARASLGVSFIGLNPLHALHNRVPYNTSPYLPLSLYFKNLIYIDIESVSEFASSPAAQAFVKSARIQEQLQQLRDAELVEYQAVAHLKGRFLKLLFRALERNRNSQPQRAAAFDRYCGEQGALLDRFALYCALNEVLHKGDGNLWTWKQWPPEFQHPDNAACQEFTGAHQRLIGYYKYIQFVIDEQLAGAQAYAREQGMPVGLYHDLALATDHSGADLWAYSDFYIKDCRVGAPPDDLSPGGQDWAFPPPNTEAHRANGYRLYRDSIRKIVSFGGALRIDHVMRLFRLFWIPEGVSPNQGTYVRDLATDLMRILALESVRAQNIIVGEDLGTVTDEIRDMLASFSILSYRLFYFERYPGGVLKQSWEYPRLALVASSTHDLATMAGFWLGRDIEARRRAGLVDDAGAWQQQDDRQREKQNMLNALHKEHLLPDGFPRDAGQVPEVNADLHQAIIGFLARVPSMLLLLNQEDLTKETEQQNLPGSTSEYPNWQRKMRASIEDLYTVWAPYAAMFRDQLRSNGRAS